MKNKLTERIDRATINSSLRTKLLWLYSVLIVLPLIVFTAFTAFSVNKTVQSQTFLAAQKRFDDAANATIRTMSRLDSVQELLVQDWLIYRVASKGALNYPALRQLEDMNQLAATFRQLRMLSEVDSIKLYVENDLLYSRENRNIFSLSDNVEADWYKKLMLSDKTSVWFAPEDFGDQPESERQIFSSMRIIYNPASVNEPIAVLRVDINADRLEKAFKADPVTENGIMLLFDGTRPLLLSGNDHEFTDDMIPQLDGIAHGSWSKIDRDGNAGYAQVMTVGNSGWRMASIIPQWDMLKLSGTLFLQMLLLTILVGIGSYLLALAISRSSLRRIEQLAIAMAQVEEGDLTVTITPVGGDEIGRLMDNFHSMMARMNRLMDEKYAYGQQIKSLELKALQAQINPHFLYNSLDLINCMAIKRDMPEITSMVSALAKFYKLSLSHGRDVITVGDELTHAELYIQIQNLRFENRIAVERQIEPGLEKHRIIKIVLQPIIENAIIHGIFERPDKSGRLIIRGWHTEEGLFLSVTDNGVGMTPDIVELNFSPTPPGGIADTTGGYGVRNIHDRIKLAYGQAYGLSCQSTPNAGTTVTIHIPPVAAE